MQDDLASFLEGGYDSELFLPTIDFILMLKNQVKSQEQEQEQSIDLSNFDIPKVYDPSYFDKVSLKATGEIIKGADISGHAKDALLAYLDNMEIQRAKHLGIIGNDGQDIAQSQGLSRRASISAAKKKDRGTNTVKSMFESIVGSLNSLQVSINSANKRNKQNAQESIQQQNRIKELLNRVTGKNSSKYATRLTVEDKFSRATRKFMKKMSDVLRNMRKQNNEDGNSGDNQLGRVKINPKDIFEQKHGITHDPKEDQSKTAQDMMQILASKGIDATKKAAKDGKESEDEKTLAGARNRNRDIQNRAQRNRMRRNFMIDDAQHSQHHMTDEMRHKADSEKRVDDLTAEKAVKQLQNMGVSLGDATAVKSNKDLDALAKVQDKQRGS